VAHHHAVVKRSAEVHSGRLTEVSLRAMLAGSAGLALPVSLLFWMAAVAMVVPSDRACGLFGCLGYVFLAWEGGRWAALVLAWPLLHLLRVRPAFPVALGGAALLVLIWELAAAHADPLPYPGFLLWFSLFGGIPAYALVAALTAPGARWATRTIVAAGCVAYAAVAVPLLPQVLIVLFKPL
jgi:hypothetical protein